MITFAPFADASRRAPPRPRRHPLGSHHLRLSFLNIPHLEGLIRRRLLVNFLVDPAVIQKLLPGRFRPKLHRGHAVAGLCLIRLEQMRPARVPALFGFSSENAAHRVAVEWTTREGDTREGVFIFRRDTNSTLGQLAGGRIFPGVHHPARFQITDLQDKIDFRMITREGHADIHLQGTATDALPPASCFDSLAESSKFFESGSLGYSPVRQPGQFEAVRLEIMRWSVRPFGINRVESRWLTTNLPGAKFDHALIMRDVPHRWHTQDHQL